MDPASAFTLACSVTTTGTETYTAGSLTPETATATITAPPIPGGRDADHDDQRAAAGPHGQSRRHRRDAGRGHRRCHQYGDGGRSGHRPAAQHGGTGGRRHHRSRQGGHHRHRPQPHHALHPDGGGVAQPYTAGRHTPPFADDGYGDFLTDASQTLFGHEPTLCAACNLTGAEFALIAGALGFGPATPLTLDNVSALFRFGWLAHTLGLSVLEFLDLRQFTGLDPFAALDPAATRARRAADHPLPPPAQAPARTPA